MSEAIAQSHPSVFNFSNILRALFKHKGKILLLTLLGLLAAAGVYFFYPPVYVSQAKLLVRYVIERSGVDPTIDSTDTRNRETAANAINSEAEILNSWDLAVQTADVIGPKKLLPRAKNPTAAAAAAKISSGLNVTLHKGDNILFVSYRDRDPELAPLVLNELITHYFIKHLEVHRSAGAFDFVTQQTDQVRAQLNQTEDALRPLREKAGIISLSSGTTALQDELTKTEDLVHDSEAALAEQGARVQQIDTAAARKANSSGPSVTPKATPAGIAGTSVKAAPALSPGSSAQPAATAIPKLKASNAEILQYQSLLSQLQQLHKTETGLESRYTSANELVQTNQRQIAELEKKRRDLEAAFPDLPDTIRGLSGRSGDKELNPALEKANLAGLKAKTAALKARLHDVKEQINQLSELRPRIAELERKEELEEANYKYFQATLEKARIDEALDPSKMPNISAVQKASPSSLDTTSRNRIVGGLAAGGLAVGVAISFLLELVLNRTVKAGSELESHLGIPLLLSIPRRNPKARALPASTDPSSPKALATSATNGTHPAPWDSGHFIRPYAEAIRDRLNLYFERHQMTHKPKLVGVTGLSQGAGTSTLAAGLAAALSEVG
ncbi:MAG TPA: Wzz/FepE/Etk N-terminal domain-containing protein, partial [Chthoniobacterales bacterium]